MLVDADPEVAFTVFTERDRTVVARWPGTASTAQGGSVAFADGTIVETAPTGEVAVWGTVTRWEPPSTLAFTWHPGHDADQASRVTVTFAAAGEQTLVRLEHGGWEVFADPEAARAEYGEGWPMVLDRFNDAFGETWVALLHVPGPNGPEGSIFADPRFGDHVAFLQRMTAAGYLVAAGSFGDELGAGMTILRLPGANRLDEATRLATVDDLSVASGFFSATVRPWNVVMQG